MRGASKSVSFHFHPPHVLFNGTILVGGLVFSLAAGCHSGCGTELLVGRLGRTRDGVATIDGRLLGGGLLGFGAADDDKTAALLFAVEDWPQRDGTVYQHRGIRSRKSIWPNTYASASGRQHPIRDVQEKASTSESGYSHFCVCV